MPCNTCEKLKKAVGEEKDPLSLLHLIISILMPDAAISADAIIGANIRTCRFRLKCVLKRQQHDIGFRSSQTRHGRR